MKEVFLSETVRKMILVDTVDKVKDFVAIANKCDCDIDVVSGRHVINATSIMGMFSLSLSEPVELRIYDAEKAPEILEKFEDYIIDQEPPAIENPYEKAVIL